MSEEFTEEKEILENQISQIDENIDERKLAKAGKRSAKAIKESEEIIKKEERKAKIASGEIEDGSSEVKKGPKPTTRPKIERRSKKYQESAKKIESGKIYSVEDGLKLTKETSITKFDSSIEVHVKLNVDPRHADQNIRNTVSLPAGTGKVIKVAVFASADLHNGAKDAGADFVYDDELLDKLAKDEIEFDILISTPANMPKLAKFARTLGPKGLMPSPKAGTVSTDVAKAVNDAKAGKIEYRVDKQGIIHVAIGRVSFSTKDLIENYNTLIQSIKDAKPSSVKGGYIKSIYLTTTMGPSIPVEA